VLESLRARRVGYPAAVLLVLATIGILRFFPGLADSSVALLLLLAVFLAAWIWESGPGALAAVLATLGFNFFFIPPVHTFTVEDPRNVVALAVFLLSGLLIGRLSALARSRLRQLEMERTDLAAMIRLSQAFLSDTNRESLLGAAAERLRGSLNAEQVEILLADEESGLPFASSTAQGQIRFELAELAFRRGKFVVVPSDLGGAEIYLPIPIGLQRAGVLIARGMKSSERLAEGCAVLLGLALVR
jgi:two-component system sensor histidine kinase KdpD